MPRQRVRRGIICCLALAPAVFSLRTPAQAQDASRLFDGAVSAYQRGHYDSAAAGFHFLVRGGIDDPRVWYNLGNSEFKSGKIGAALVAYRRGLRLSPRDGDLNANYRYVRLFAPDKIEPVGVFFLEEWWRALVRRISGDEARTLAAVAFWASVLLTAWRLWPNRLAIGTVAAWVVMSSWAIWLVATAAGATCYHRDVTSRAGAVISIRTDVRGGPGDTYALQFVAHDGLEGAVERTESGWYLVRFPNGLKGWVASDAFEII